MKIKSMVFKLERIMDDLRFEGFALPRVASRLGRPELLDDMTPAYGVGENTRIWKSRKLAEFWKIPRVYGRVRRDNDYPCINLSFPAFSARACDALSDLLLASGELLPISHRIGEYYFFNITKVLDALNRTKSKCLWHEPPNIVLSVQRHEFFRSRLAGASVFRCYEDPMSVFVTEEFRDRVMESNLRGFFSERYGLFRLAWIGNRLNRRKQYDHCLQQGIAIG